MTSTQQGNSPPLANAANHQLPSNPLRFGQGSSTLHTTYVVVKHHSGSHHQYPSSEPLGTSIDGHVALPLTGTANTTVPDKEHPIDKNQDPGKLDWSKVMVVLHRMRDGESVELDTFSFDYLCAGQTCQPFNIQILNLQQHLQSSFNIEFEHWSLQLRGFDKVLSWTKKDFCEITTRWQQTRRLDEYDLHLVLSSFQISETKSPKQTSSLPTSQPPRSSSSVHNHDDDVLFVESRPVLPPPSKRIKASHVHMEAADFVAGRNLPMTVPPMSPVRITPTKSSSHDPTLDRVEIISSDPTEQSILDEELLVFHDNSDHSDMALADQASFTFPEGTIILDRHHTPTANTVAVMKALRQRSDEAKDGDFDRFCSFLRGEHSRPEQNPAHSHWDPANIEQMSYRCGFSDMIDSIRHPKWVVPQIPDLYKSEKPPYWYQVVEAHQLMLTTERT